VIKKCANASKKGKKEGGFFQTKSLPERISGRFWHICQKRVSALFYQKTSETTTLGQANQLALDAALYDRKRSVSVSNDLLSELLLPRLSLFFVAFASSFICIASSLRRQADRANQITGVR
jgi:hypothetical protein